MCTADKKTWVEPQLRRIGMERARARIVRAIELLQKSGDAPEQVQRLHALLETIDEDISA